MNEPINKLNKVGQILETVRDVLRNKNLTWVAEQSALPAYWDVDDGYDGYYWGRGHICLPCLRTGRETIAEIPITICLWYQDKHGTEIVCGLVESRWMMNSNLQRKDLMAGWCWDGLPRIELG